MCVVGWGTVIIPATRGNMLLQAFCIGLLKDSDQNFIGQQLSVPTWTPAQAESHLIIVLGSFSDRMVGMP